MLRVALVLPTEYAYARDVLRGVIAATRARNMYAGEQSRRAGAIAAAGSAPASASASASASRSRSRSGSGSGGGGGAGPETVPWLFRVYRGIYGHSSKYLAKWFRDWDPHGIICQIYDDRLAKVYREAGRPVVELFESRAESEFTRILPDDEATGALAAQHFVERGFRNFAFFGAEWMLWSRKREAGFRAEIERAFRARGQTRGRRSAGAARGAAGGALPAEATSFTYASYGVDAGGRSDFTGPRKRAASGEWIASLPKPLALFAANDLWGFELVQAARESDCHVPNDVAILGVDNEELLCEIAHPPLSSIRMGGEQIGAAAVAAMERLLRERDKKTARAAAGRAPAGAIPFNDAIPPVPPAGVVTRQSTDVLAVGDPEVAAAVRHIRAHAVGGLTVKEMLRAVPVNRRTLERRFVNVLGHTPLDEIRRVRLERAKALLQTDLPIYAVAERSGFGTPEYLATSFLRATGMSPSQYRRQFVLNHVDEPGRSG